MSSNTFSYCKDSMTNRFLMYLLILLYVISYHNLCYSMLIILHWNISMYYYVGLILDLQATDFEMWIQNSRNSQLISLLKVCSVPHGSCCRLDTEFVGHLSQYSCFTVNLHTDSTLGTHCRIKWWAKNPQVEIWASVNMNNKEE